MIGRTGVRTQRFRTYIHALVIHAPLHLSLNVTDFMSRNVSAGRPGALSALRRFARTAPREAVVEHCELCNLALPPKHRHLLHMSSRQVVCACDGCALAFHGVDDGRFRAIPRDVRTLPGFRMTDAQWNGLALPINLAFFLYSTTAEKMVAMYPSPAGATESLLSLKAWETLTSENPVLARMEPDVEALLVNRVEQERNYYLAPIDVCYRLVGLIRMHWRGLSGGDAVWQEIEQFFDRLNQQARPVKENHHA